MESNITPEFIIQYLRSLPYPDSPLLREMEHCAQQRYIPIIQKEAAQLLRVLSVIRQPERILEIGTAIGYSALHLLTGLRPGGKLVTIEKDPDMTELAWGYLERAGKSGVVEVIEDDALCALRQLDGSYDMIFMDAAKGQYQEFFDLAFARLKPGGILISDNVLYKGYVADGSAAAHKRRTIVQRLRAYLDMLVQHSQLDTCVIPIGDGVAVSVRKWECEEHGE